MLALRRCQKAIKMWVVLVTSLASTPAWATVEVVATLPSLASIVSEVGGPHVHVKALAAPNEDPHFVDARPNLVVALNRADLLVANGLELEEGWLPPLQIAARNSEILAGGAGFVEAAQFIEALEVPMARIDRSMGDLHPGGNPHFLNDPRRVAQVAVGLAKTLATLDPKMVPTTTLAPKLLRTHCIRSPRPKASVLRRCHRARVRSSPTTSRLPIFCLGCISQKRGHWSRAPAYLPTPGTWRRC